jgi:hypothetical protein
MNRHLKSCLYLIVAASLLPGIGAGQTTNPATSSGQSTVVQKKKPAPEQTDANAPAKIGEAPSAFHGSGVC